MDSGIVRLSSDQSLCESYAACFDGIKSVLSGTHDCYLPLTNSALVN